MTMKCLRCDGAGGSDQFINYGHGEHGFGWVSCSYCNSTGTIDDEQIKRFELSMQLTSLVSRKHTVREMAKFMGITLAQASALRTGRPMAKIIDIEAAIDLYSKSDLPDIEINEGLAKALGVKRG